MFLNVIPAFAGMMAKRWCVYAQEGSRSMASPRISTEKKHPTHPQTAHASAPFIRLCVHIKFRFYCYL
jgi:hypothetical protein